MFVPLFALLAFRIIFILFRSSIGGAKMFQRVLLRYFGRFDAFLAANRGGGGGLGRFSPLDPPMPTICFFIQVEKRHNDSRHKEVPNVVCMPIRPNSFISTVRFNKNVRPIQVLKYSFE